MADRTERAGDQQRSSSSLTDYAKREAIAASSWARIAHHDVVPTPDGYRRTSSSRPQKHPKACGWPEWASSDPQTIAAQFNAAGGPNYSALPQPGFFWWDNDGARDRLSALVAMLSTPTVRTRRGRYRALLRLPADCQELEVRGQQFRGFDIVGSSGSPMQVVGAGSIHAVTRRPVVWAPGADPRTVPIAVAPAELVAFLRSHGLLVPRQEHAREPGHREAAGTDRERATTRESSATATSSARAKPAASWCASRLTGFPPSEKRPEGTRETYLLRRAHALRADGLEQGAIRAELRRERDQNCDSGSHPVTDRKLDAMARCAARKPAGRSRDAHNRDRGQVAYVRRRIAAAEWRGLAGTTALEVLLALLDIATRCGSLAVSASQRQLAELAGYNRRQTIAQALDALEATGWIRRVQTGAGSRASVIAINPAGGIVQERTNILPGGKGGEVLGGSCTIALGHDAFRRGGLSKTARLVYAALREKPWKSGAELARALGKSPATVTRALVRLEAQTLAARTASGWTATDGSLDAAAERMGTAGSGVRQHEQHEHERHAYRVAYEAARARVGKPQTPPKLVLVPREAGNDAAGSPQSDERGPVRPATRPRNAMLTAGAYAAGELANARPMVAREGVR